MRITCFSLYLALNRSAHLFLARLHGAANAAVQTDCAKLTNFKHCMEAGFKLALVMMSALERGGLKGRGLPVGEEDADTAEAEDEVGDHHASLVAKI